MIGMWNLVAILRLDALLSKGNNTCLASLARQVVSLVNAVRHIVVNHCLYVILQCKDNRVQANKVN